jgi:hypothetical protein
MPWRATLHRRGLRRPPARTHDDFILSDWPPGVNAEPFPAHRLCVPPSHFRTSCRCCSLILVVPGFSAGRSSRRGIAGLGPVIAPDFSRRSPILAEPCVPSPYNPVMSSPPAAARRAGGRNCLLGSGCHASLRKHVGPRRRHGYASVAMAPSTYRRRRKILVRRRSSGACGPGRGRNKEKFIRRAFLLLRARAFVANFRVWRRSPLQGGRYSHARNPRLRARLHTPERGGRRRRSADGRREAVVRGDPDRRARRPDIPYPLDKAGGHFHDYFPRMRASAHRFSPQKAAGPLRARVACAILCLLRSGFFIRIPPASARLVTRWRGAR